MPESTTRVATRTRAYAPGSIGNLGPGLDILGCAVTGKGDVVEAEWSDDTASSPITIAETGHAELHTNPARHAAGIAAAAVLRAAKSTRPVTLRAKKGLPLSGGQGGSAASAVAGAVAVNALLGSPLDSSALLSSALEAEELLSGRHADNVAPALLGGIVLVRSIDPLDVVRIPSPPELRIVLAHPAQRLRTAEARAVLPATLERTVALRQAAQIAAMVAAFTSGDLELLRRSIDDRIAEPARAPLLPGFTEAKAAALAAGALGCSISGAGPTSFALAANDTAAQAVARAMHEAYARAGVSAEVRVERVDHRGAQVEVLGPATARESAVRPPDPRGAR